MKPSDEALVLVMGETGVGKSTFIRCLTGSADIVIGHGMTSGTKDVREFPTKLKVGHRKLVLVDTPGTGAGDLTDVQVLATLASWLSQTYKAGRRVLGVLFLQRIDSTPFTNNYRKQVALFRRICGRDFLDHVVLVSTMWSESTTAKGTQYVTSLERESLFWRPLVAGGARLARFHNTKQSAHDIVSSFPGSEPASLLIQTELVEAGLNLRDTSAGKLLAHENDGDLREYKRQLEQLNKNPGPRDKAVEELVAKEYDKYKHQDKLLKLSFWKKLLKRFGIK